MPNKILFDFDKTIVSVNSFPLWVKYLLYRGMRELNICMVLRIFKLLVSRKILNHITHQDFKLELMRLPISDAWNDEFALKLLKKVNHEVSAALNAHVQRGDVVVVSSAAPDIYLVATIKHIVIGGFDSIAIIGASLTEVGINENYKASKVSNLYVGRILHPGELIDVLYTDSWDDLPLAEISKKIFLINPDEKSLEMYSANNDLNGRVFYDIPLIK